MLTIHINEKTYKRFMRRYNKKLGANITEGFNLSFVQWFDNDRKIVISAKYEKIAGIVSKTFYYNRVI